jgi:hypothetical protein
MTAVAMSFGVAHASSRSSDVLVDVGKPKRVHRHHHRVVDPQLIRRLRRSVWRWQATMGLARTQRAAGPSTLRTLLAWRRIARRAYLHYIHPPHQRDWLCIHRYEGSWSDSGDPYWGGLQMDRGFMEGYAPHDLLRRGWANHWSPLEQMWVAERAYHSGRGFYA